tara:strand:+ start:19016 stop:21190 length:2175 start_codon:yes stop_codon:yes gene_type:complete
MKSVVKVLGLVVGAIALLVIAALFFLTRLFDPNDYKDDIREAAREQANIELALDGDIGWSLFPWLGMELKDVGVAPVDNPAQPLAKVGTLGLGVKVLPLLRRQVRMSDVILDDVQLQLVRNDQGVGNWETVGPQDSAAAEQGSDASAEAQTQDDGANEPLQITVESVQVTNASVHYEDRQTGQILSLDEANLTTGALIPGEPFDVSFLGLLTLDQPAMRVRMDLKTVATLQPGEQRYLLSGVDLKVDASGEPFAGRAVNLQLQGDGLVDLAEQVAELTQLRLSLADMRATGQLKMSDLDSEPQLAGRLDVAAFDARDLLRDLGQPLPDMADPGALSSVALSANLKGSTSSLMLNDLQLALDGFALQGSLGVADFERQALRFDLAGDNLNLDNYLPPREEGEGGSSSAGSGGSRSQAAPEPWSDEDVLPLEALARLDVDGKLTLEQVTLTGQTIKPFTMAAKARDGVVRLTQLDGGIFGGSFTASGSIDTRKTPVGSALKAQLKGIDSAAAQQAYEVPQQVSGLLDMSLDVTTGGNSLRRWMNTLNGSASFKVEDGALLGVNLEQQVCRAIALANRKSLSAEHGSENTAFEQLDGSFTIRNGVVGNSDLVVDLPGLAGKGKGQINLPEQRLDYRLGLLLEGDRSEMPDEACQVNERYADIEWPIRCQGYLHNAGSSCGVDTEGVGQIAAKLVGNEVQRKLEERIDDSLGDKAPELRDAIKGLFSR